MITKHSDGSATILAYGCIDEFEISAQGIAQSLIDLAIEPGADIELRIHSYGGSVFEASAIISSLKPYNVTATVDGIAASAAATIALSANTLRMSKGSQLMIHNPWSIVMGDSDEMRKQADVLDKIKKDMAEIYKARIGDDAEVKMSDETWFTADEAMEAGIIDSIVEGYTKPSALVVKNEAAINFDISKTRFVACLETAEYAKKLNDQHGELLDQIAEQATDIAEMRAKVEKAEEAEASAVESLTEAQLEIEKERKRADLAERKSVSLQAQTLQDPALAEELNQETKPKQTAWQKYQAIEDPQERRQYFTNNKNAIFASQPKG